MRSLVATITQNVPTGGANVMSMTGLLAKFGVFSQQVDEQLTKITSGEITIEVADTRDKAWTFINNSLETGNGMLPPWLTLQVGGNVVFVGLIDPARVVQHQDSTTHSLEISAVAWSAALDTVYLGSPTALPWQQNKAYATGSSVLNGSNLYTAVRGGISSSTNIGPTGILAGHFLPWQAGVTYPVGACVIYGTDIWTAVTPLQGTAPAADRWTDQGPGTQAQLDGTVYWAYTPPSWQRPVPTLALPGASSPSGPGFSADAPDALGNQGRGSRLAGNQCLKSVYFAMPCGWIYTGAVLQFTSQPVFNLTLPPVPNAPDFNSDHPITHIVDIEGQVWDWPAGGPWTLTTPWTLAGDPILSYLPNPAFPPGVIISVNGTQYQMNSGGTAWSTTIVPVVPSGSFKVISTATPAAIYPVNADTGFGGAMEAVLSSPPWPTAKQSTAVACLTPQNFEPVSGPLNGYFTAGFQIANALAQDVRYWTVQVPVLASPATPCHQIFLDSVNGIVPGDGITLTSSDVSGSWTVAGVDPILVCVNTIEPVSNLLQGAHIVWDTNSSLEYVNEDATKMLPLICAPYSCDMSQFVSPVTPFPMFSWLPSRGGMGNDLFAFGDMEATLTGTVKLATGASWFWYPSGVKVALPSYSWTGTPEAGWTQVTPSVAYAPTADWTCQVASTPANLMPCEAFAVNPWSRMRNRAYSDCIYRMEDNGVIQVNNNGTVFMVNGAFVQTTSTNPYTYKYTQGGTDYLISGGNVNFFTWNALGAPAAGSFPVYDYTGTPLKKYLFTNGWNTNSRNYTSVQVYVPSTYSGGVVATWNASGSPWNWPNGFLGADLGYVQCAVPAIGQGFTQGQILGYAVWEKMGPANGNQWPGVQTLSDTLQLVSATGAPIASYTVPSALLGGTLYTTPYATYLVAGFAIGIVTYPGSGTALNLTIFYMVDQVTSLFGNTLAAIDAYRICIFGRQDIGTGSSQKTTTWMFILQAGLSSTLDQSVIWSEQIGESVPSTLGAIRDPSKTGRVIGHYGGSLFCVDTSRPLVIERWVPGGMTASQALEHIGQVFSAVMIPDATGTMHVVSRATTPSPTNYNVLQTKIDSIWGWKDFYSIVRVTSSDNKFYFDAYGQLGSVYQQGGRLMTIANQPMIWSRSGAAGMAVSNAAWFGVPRSGSKQSWTYPDPTTAASWEWIKPFDRITVNGGATAFRVMSIQIDYVAGTCDVDLLTD